MTCRPARWWPGLIPLALLWAGANAWNGPSLEAALAARARALLPPEAASWARVEARGRALALAGEAPTEAALTEAAARLAAVPGARFFENRGGVLSEQRPFVLQALREGGALRLQGFAPPERRAALLEAARAAHPGLSVTDELRSARGEPAGFERAASFALDLIAGLPEGRARVSDELVALEGLAPDRETFDRLRAIRPPDGVALSLAGLRPPAVSPYRVRLAKTRDRVRLEGFAPSDEAKRRAAEAARALSGDIRVEDALELASGLEPGIDYGAAVRFALGALAPLRDGEVGLVDGRLSVEGVTMDREARDRAAADWRGGLPAGLKAGSVAIRTVPASPFVFRARRTDGAVTLGGYLPDAAAREQVVAAARRLFLAERIRDEARLADGAPPHFAAAASLAVESLAQVAAGEAVLDDAALKLSGSVLYPQTAERIRATLPRAAPPGWSVAVEISGPDGDRPSPVACRNQAESLLAREPVRFEGAGIARPSLGLLDDLAEILQSCPGVALDVVGFADGPPESPARLARAQAVRDHLVQFGIEPERVGAAAGEGPRPAGPVALRWREGKP